MLPLGFTLFPEPSPQPYSLKALAPYLGNKECAKNLSSLLQIFRLYNAFQLELCSLISPRTTDAQ